jgi:hypothetical protein
VTKRAAKVPPKARRKKASRTRRLARSLGLVGTPPKESAQLTTANARFAEVLALIEAARNRAYQAVNSELVRLYWQSGST